MNPLAGKCVTSGEAFLMTPIPRPPPSSVCPRCGDSLAPGGLCATCVFSQLAGEEEEPKEEVRSAPPERVGEYDLVEPIARGGMGVVWRARQRRLNREVALKFVLEGALPGESVARRFRQEAEVAAQLSHPHIVSIYEVGEADGRYFISMELATGGTLAQRLQQGRMEPRAAAELMAKLARAVQHAHDRGVLHRDLKPANVLFDAVGEPRISDFGLARLVKGDGMHTATGALVGTPAYMSPEQANGRTKGLTTGSDVYGLGAIFYELLAGRPPFGGEVAVEVLRQVLDEDPVPLAGLDRDLETMCFKCLAKDPEARYRSAQALAEEIDRWLAGIPILARRASAAERLWKWLRRHPLLTAVSLTLTVAAVVIGWLMVASQLRVAAAQGKAEASAAESVHRQADQHTTVAILAIERGDSYRALPSLAAAIRIGTGDPVRDRVNRIRFESILRLGPRLEQMWFPGWVTYAGLAPARECVVLSSASQIRFLKMSDGTDLYPPVTDPRPMLKAVLHPKLDRVLGETESGKCVVWDLRTGQQIARIAARFLDPQFLFQGGEERLALWEGTEARRFSPERADYDGAPLPHPAKVEWAYLGAGGRRVLTCAADRQLRVWDADTGAPIGAPIPCPERASFRAGEPGRGLAFVQPNDERGMLIDLERGTPPQDLAVRGDIRAAAWLDSNLNVAVSTREGFAIMGSMTGDLQFMAPHNAHGNDAVFSGPGHRVFTRAVNGTGRLWSLQSARPLTPMLWESADPRFAAMDPAGECILVTDRQSAMRLWRLRERDGAVSETLGSSAAKKLLWLRAEIAERARSMGPFRRETPGRPTLESTGGGALSLRVVDPATGRDLCPPLRHDGRVLDAVFSPDGRRLASAADNQCAYLWDLTTGEQIGPVLRHERAVEVLAFSPDGTLLITGAHYAFRLWETSTGMTVSPPMMQPSLVREAVWKPDGTSVVTTDRDGRSREWSVAANQRAAEELETLSRVYSAHRVTQGGALAPIAVEEARAAWEGARKMAVP